MRTYQRIIAGGLVLAGLAGLLGCDKKSTESKEESRRSVAEQTVDIYAGNQISIDAADLDGDGRSDLVIAGTKLGDNGIVELYTDIQGLKRKIADIPLYAGGNSGLFGGSGDLEIRLADLNNTGRKDIVVAGTKIGNNGIAEVYVVRNLGEGNFSEPNLIGSVPVYSGNQVGLAIGDRNADGKLDVIVAGTKLGNNSVGEVYSLINQGDGNYSLQE
ncbi:VCBS repeat-containing protein [Patescibacteria group bacterium]|nr:VCBS repeat-containing protein [Patescibacteria group bacterium]MCG2696356.1 VCBS repeat-containing protein [Candidatus Portnoybacteria bacterium]MCG2699929.1 VCBS repeat-containing protein [Candidatus Parcubacteria bacterium]